MIYSSICEAFNNSEEKRKPSEQSGQNDQIYNFDNYNDIDVTKEGRYPVVHNPNPPTGPIFTAQGDFNSGTSLKSLQNKYHDSDSEDDDLSCFDYPEKVYDHNYYINKFVKELLENKDGMSIDSSSDYHIYKHVKTCNYCKSKINEIMRMYHKPEIVKEQNIIKEVPNKTMLQTLQDNIGGYELSELMIIILAGIVLVFILDLLVRIGKRLKKS